MAECRPARGVEKFAARIGNDDGSTRRLRAELCHQRKIVRANHEDAKRTICRPAFQNLGGAPVDDVGEPCESRRTALQMLDHRLAETETLVEPVAQQRRQKLGQSCQACRLGDPGRIACDQQIDEFRDRRHVRLGAQRPALLLFARKAHIRERNQHLAQQRPGGQRHFAVGDQVGENQPVVRTHQRPNRIIGGHARPSLEDECNIALFGRTSGGSRGAGKYPGRPVDADLGKGRGQGCPIQRLKRHAIDEVVCRFLRAARHHPAAGIAQFGDQRASLVEQQEIRDLRARCR